MAWYHQQLQVVLRGNEWNVARAARIAQEGRANARADEERQLAELSAGRREGLRGITGKIRGAQRVAEQVINGM